MAFLKDERANLSGELLRITGFFSVGNNLIG
jgi:hypothetical protein